MGERIINVTIADRQYKLTIDERKEDKIKEAEQIINEKLKEYSVGYSYKDKQDLISMIAMQYVVSFLDDKERAERQEIELSEQLEGIEKVLEE